MQGWQPRRHLWSDCLEKMWEPRRLTTLWASTACYRDSFTYLLHGIFLQIFYEILRFKISYIHQFLARWSVSKKIIEVCSRSHINTSYTALMRNSIWIRLFRISAGSPGIITEGLLGFTQALQWNVRMLHRLNHHRIFPNASLCNIQVHLSCHHSNP
jgi:hypothetical protein